MNANPDREKLIAALEVLGMDRAERVDGRRHELIYGYKHNDYYQAPTAADCVSYAAEIIADAILGAPGTEDA